MKTRDKSKTTAMIAMFKAGKKGDEIAAALGYSRAGCALMALRRMGYSPEKRLDGVKDEIAREHYQNGRGICELARAYGHDRRTVSVWIAARKPPARLSCAPAMIEAALAKPKMPKPKTRIVFSFSPATIKRALAARGLNP